VTPTSHEAILLLTRPPIDAHWLEEELDALLRLVEAGETLDLVGRLHSLVGSPRPSVVTHAGAGAVDTAPAPESV
jgi:hypothetical protein